LSKPQCSPCGANRSAFHEEQTAMHSSVKQIVILDWDDTLMPSSYLLSNLNVWNNRKTGEVTSVQMKPGSKVNEDEFCESLEESGTAAQNLLTSLCNHFMDTASGRRLFIVTNGSEKWMQDSLIIAGAVCPIYGEIREFIVDHEIQMISARNTEMEYQYWKQMSYERTLNQFLGQRQCQKLHIITIGDQLTDHCSIEMAPSFWLHHQSVVHHEIVCYPGADARYIAAELKYISGLFFTDDSSKSPLFHFSMNHENAVKLRFDGESSKLWVRTHGGINSEGDGSIIAFSTCFHFAVISN